MRKRKRKENKVQRKKCKKRLAKTIYDEDQGLNNFGISLKIQKIMAEQQKRKKRKNNHKRMNKKKSFLSGK